MPSVSEIVKDNIATRNTVLDLSTIDESTDINDNLYQLIGECDHVETLKLNDSIKRFLQGYIPGTINIPAFLSRPILRKLKALHISNCNFRISDELDILTSFTALEVLEFKGCSFNNFKLSPELKKLKRLDLLFCIRVNLSFASTLPNLEMLSIRNCGIQHLQELHSLQNLKYLDAAYNEISSIRPILNLPNLETLDLSFNELKDPGLVTHIKSLKQLFLNGIMLTTMEDIVQLPVLEELYVANNNIRQLILPDGNLKKLDIRENWLRHIKKTGSPNKLEILELSGNQLEEIKILGKLKNLRKLNLSRNSLRSIDDLATLINLEDLDINSNNITDVSGLMQLPRLQQLSIHNNIIKILPEAIFTNFILPHYKLPLDSVRIIKNAIIHEKLFEEAATVRDYEKMIETGITPTKAHFSEVQRFLTKFLILSNPLESPSSDILSQGPEATLAFYKNLQVSELVPFREAKVILLGEPDAGKSSLLNYFLDEPFIEEKSVTRGVRIARLNFREGKDQYRINFWDFGGQEVQQSLHQYFLTDNTLYLIILNAVTDEQPDKYLQFLDNHAPNSPFFIITNKDDLNTRSKLKNNQIATTFENRWKGPEYRISLKQAASLKNCRNQVEFDERTTKLQELFTAIRKTFLQLPHIEQGFLSNYKNVKQVVEEMYEKRKKPYITMQEFNDCCKEQGIAPGTEKGLLSQLNFIGTVRYVDENNLRGIHILNPEWLSDGMYKIITDGDIKTKMMGKIRKKDVVPILHPSCAADYTYQDHEIDYLITLMCHFRVAYFDEPTGHIYLPDAFPDDLPPELKRAAFINGTNHYYFSYETDIPSYIIIRFIVKMFKYVKGSQYWSKGIVLQYQEHASNYCEALIEQHDRVIDIWVKGKDIQDFFLLIRDALRYAHEERFKAWKEMIDLGDYQVSYQDILTFRYGGETTFKSPVIDQATGALKKYNINEVLGRFEVSKKEEISSNPTTVINMEGGDFINHGQFQGEGNTQTLPPATEKINPAIKTYKQKMLRRWKRNAWILLLLSLTLTVTGFIILQQETIRGIEQEKWTRFRNSAILPFAQLIVAAAWSLFVGKLFYDRILDKSKEKAFLETLKIPEELL